MKTDDTYERYIGSIEWAVKRDEILARGYGLLRDDGMAACSRCVTVWQPEKPYERCPVCQDHELAWDRYNDALLLDPPEIDDEDVWMAWRERMKRAVADGTIDEGDARTAWETARKTADT